MSLFKTKEWCSIQLGNGKEVFDVGCLCVANFKLDGSKTREAIVVGSFAGLVRIFDLKFNTQDDSYVPPSVNFKAENLLCEKLLENPILQILGGYFVSVAQDSVHLAILHARKLSIYAFSEIATGKVEYGNQYDLLLIYEHNLLRSAYNMVCGPFGGVVDKDYICVQSLDCTVTFYEEENIAFSRFLPCALLPGPMAYVPKTDSLLTASSLWQIESYKYQFLAVAADSKTKEEANTMTTGKRVTFDWSYSAGEPIIQIVVMDISPAPLSILALGERTIFCLSECGVLRFAEKLEYTPICLLGYAATYEGYVQYLVATQTRTLLLYVDTTLRWAAQMPRIPVCLDLLHTGPLRGILMSISDDGRLDWSYLGTDPAFYGIPNPKAVHVDYNKRRQEFKHFQTIMRKADQIKDVVKSAPSIAIVSIKCEIPQNLDSVSLAYDSEIEETIPSLTMRICISCKTNIDNMQINVFLPNVIGAQSTSFTIANFGPSFEIPVTMFMKYSLVPTSLTGHVQAVYKLPSGPPKVVETDFNLPLILISKLTQFQKAGQCRITLGVSTKVNSLLELFPEFGENEDEMSLNFRVFGRNQSVVSVSTVQNKKYMIHADSLECSWIFLYELLRRLRKLNKSDKSFTLVYQEEINWQDYFMILDKNFELRKQRDKLSELLTQKSAQFRTIEKQLLIKSKDNNCPKLAHIEDLIEITYRQITNLANAILEQKSTMFSLRHALDAVSRLQISLLALKSNLSREEFHWLEKCFNIAIVIDNQSWEELTESAIHRALNLMAMNPSESKGGQQHFAVNQEVPRAADISSLKKKILLLCEKILKKEKLPFLSTVSPSSSAQSASKSYADRGSGDKKNLITKEPIQKHVETMAQFDTNKQQCGSSGDFGTGDLPAGLKFNELGSRLLDDIQEEPSDQENINEPLKTVENLESYSVDETQREKEETVDL